MARRSTPPFRADHVGSLLRPPALHQGGSQPKGPICGIVTGPIQDFVS